MEAVLDTLAKLHEKGYSVSLSNPGGRWVCEIRVPTTWATRGDGVKVPVGWQSYTGYGARPHRAVKEAQRRMGTQKTMTTRTEAA